MRYKIIFPQIQKRTGAYQGLVEVQDRTVKIRQPNGEAFGIHGPQHHGHYGDLRALPYADIRTRLQPHPAQVDAAVLPERRHQGGSPLRVSYDELQHPAETTERRYDPQAGYR